ncbi:hypothetical protein AHiyo8_64890 [Arthrobacter sp. Hiyo8]|nr:hypothetical protein AHiyo8_64890 [Arthrobacter sp. Hiyo8]
MEDLFGADADNDDDAGSQADSDRSAMDAQAQGVRRRRGALWLSV